MNLAVIFFPQLEVFIKGGMAVIGGDDESLLSQQKASLKEIAFEESEPSME